VGQSFKKNIDDEPINIAHFLPQQKVLGCTTTDYYESKYTLELL
jgi:hypothetical protein